MGDGNEAFKSGLVRSVQPAGGAQLQDREPQQVKSPANTTSPSFRQSFADGDAVDNAETGQRSSDTRVRAKSRDLPVIISRSKFSRAGTDSGSALTPIQSSPVNSSSRHLGESFKSPSHSVVTFSRAANSTAAEKPKENIYTFTGRGPSEESGLPLKDSLSFSTSEDKLVLPVGIQNLLSEELESDENDTGIGEKENDTAEKLELPDDILRLLQTEDKKIPIATSDESGKRVGSLKNFFQDKIEEVSGRRASFDSTSEGFRSRSDSASSGRVSVPDDVSSIGRSVRSKVSAFEGKTQDTNMDATKLPPRDKINVNLVGKKFKQIQKTMKTTSDEKERAIQKPVIADVGVNRHVGVFKAKKKKAEQKREETLQKPKTTGSQRSENRHEPSQPTLTHGRVVGEPPLQNPPLASTQQRKQPTSGTEVNLPKSGGSRKNEAQSSRTREIPLVQKLLLDVVMDIRRDSERQTLKTETLGSATHPVKPNREQNGSKPADTVRVDGPENSSLNGRSGPLHSSSKPHESGTNRQTQREESSDDTSVHASGSAGDKLRKTDDDRRNVPGKICSSTEGVEKKVLDSTLRFQGSALQETPCVVQVKKTAEYLHESTGDTAVRVQNHSATPSSSPAKLSQKVDAIDHPKFVTVIFESKNMNTSSTESPEAPNHSAGKAKKAFSAVDTSGPRSAVLPQPSTKVTQIASAIQSHPDSFRTKKPANASSKDGIGGTHPSVLSIIKMIQQSKDKSKDTSTTRNKVKISPKFQKDDANTKSVRFPHREITTQSDQSEGLSAEKLSDRSAEKVTAENGSDPDERDMRDEGFREEVTTKLKRLSDVLDQTSENGTNNQGSMPLEKGGRNVESSENVRSVDEGTKQQSDASYSGHGSVAKTEKLTASSKKQTVSPAFIFSKAKTPQKTSSSIFSTLKHKITGKGSQQTPTATMTASSASEGSQESNEQRAPTNALLKEEQTFERRKTEEQQVRSTLKSAETDPKTTDVREDEASLKPAAKEVQGNNIEPREANLSVNEGIDIPGIDERGPEQVRDLAFSTETNSEGSSLSSFTKHELFFSSVKSDSEEGGQDDEDMVSCVSESSPEASHGGHEDSATLKDSTLDDVWNIIECNRTNKPLSDVDMDSAFSFNNSLSASSASVESNQSHRDEPSRLEKVCWESGNQMSKPVPIVMQERSQSLELSDDLGEVREDYNCHHQSNKGNVELRIFEALQVNALFGLN